MPSPPNAPRRDLRRAVAKGTPGVGVPSVRRCRALAATCTPAGVGSPSEGSWAGCCSSPWSPAASPRPCSCPTCSGRGPRDPQPHPPPRFRRARPPASPAVTRISGSVAWVDGGALHLVDLDTCAERTLVATGADPMVRFSHDGTWVAFGDGSIVPADGGNVQSPVGKLTTWQWSPTRRRAGRRDRQRWRGGRRSGRRTAGPGEGRVRRDERAVRSGRAIARGGPGRRPGRDHRRRRRRRDDRLPRVAGDEGTAAGRGVVAGRTLGAVLLPVRGPDGCAAQHRSERRRRLGERVRPGAAVRRLPELVRPAAGALGRRRPVAERREPDPPLRSAGLALPQPVQRLHPQLDLAGVLTQREVDRGDGHAELRRDASGARDPRPVVARRRRIASRPAHRTGELRLRGRPLVGRRPVPPGGEAGPRPELARRAAALQGRPGHGQGHPRARDRSPGSAPRPARTATRIGRTRATGTGRRSGRPLYRLAV